MPRVPYCYPPTGTNPVADAIRQRRGERGLTPLDGMLLNSLPIAEGWNKLLGGVRTGTSLPDDVREIMILRVAARNRAAFEWMHHEPLARQAGVTDEQIRRIGTVTSIASQAALTASGSGQLSPLQAAAISYADAMTATVAVPDAIFNTLKHELGKTVEHTSPASASREDQANQKMVEATGTVAAYNMVSRFLVALDIDDRANETIPLPGEADSSSTAAAAAASSVYPIAQRDSTLGSRGLVQVRDGLTLATRVHFHSMQAPWIVLVNSLMTNLTMWDRVVPSLSQSFNVLCYDQRGHGASAVPLQPCTVEALADDVADVLSALGVEKCRAVVGVSQGGATALAFALRHPERVERVVANDTQAVSPEANFKAWEDRIALARSSGMTALARATLERWYGSGKAGDDETKRIVSDLIATTDVGGFEQGARALQKYDLIADGLLQVLAEKPTLLVAGECDGALPKTLEALAADVQQQRGTADVAFKAVPNAAHLPMMDNPQAWLDVVVPFLQQK
ncbi:unnamed protein product [Parajaminaea phylloscopi]